MFSDIRSTITYIVYVSPHLSGFGTESLFFRVDGAEVDGLGIIKLFSNDGVTSGLATEVGITSVRDALIGYIANCERGFFNWYFCIILLIR